MCTRVFLLATALAANGVRGGERITSLECWGKRAAHDFTAESVRLAKSAGFTGIFLNGGSGIGPDQIPLELALTNGVLPRLAPHTVKGNMDELRRRNELLRREGLGAWWCLWGVIGPDESDQTYPSGPSNRLFDRRSKLEMKAALLREPDLFGARNPRTLSWRGSRPLCLSHPKVRAFYREQIKSVVTAYGLKGMAFFPGDNGAECCDATCARCAKSVKDGYELMIAFANDLLASAREVRPDFELYMIVWNSGHQRLGRYLRELDPRMGLAMSFTDGYVEQRSTGTLAYNQPWANCADVGKSFTVLADACRKANRPLMALGEIAQAEVWDPLHNMPNPSATLKFLKGLAQIDSSAVVMDFWGLRRPFVSHANLAAMRAWVSDPRASDDELLLKAAAAHYGIPSKDDALVRAARAAWRTFEATDRGSSLVAWQQRFSFGIGRDRARGHLYTALTPAYLRTLPFTWTGSFTNAVPSFARFLEAARGDRGRFAAAADEFVRLAEKLDSVSPQGAVLARREAVQIRLAGELYGSEARSLAAAHAYLRRDAAELRTLIEEEIDARLRELALTAELDAEAGVHPQLVEEDIQNMRLYLSLDSFPEAPDELFSFTDAPYSE